MNTDQITYLSLSIVSVVIALLFLTFHFIMKGKKSKSELQTTNRDGIWEFTKRHFLMFGFLFFVVIAISGIALLVTH